MSQPVRWQTYCYLEINGRIVSPVDKIEITKSKDDEAEVISVQCPGIEWFPKPERWRMRQSDDCHIFRGRWRVNYWYEVGDMVAYSGMVYLCCKAHRATIEGPYPFNESADTWEVLSTT